MDDCVALPGVGPDEWSGAVIYRVSVRETALLLCDCTRGIYGLPAAFCFQNSTAWDVLLTILSLMSDSGLASPF